MIDSSSHIKNENEDSEEKDRMKWEIIKAQTVL